MTRIRVDPAPWIDIATAPKDGSWLVVNSPKYDRPYVTRWLEEDNRWDRVDEGPWDTDFDYFPPTHWLPTPPM